MANILGFEVSVVASDAADTVNRPTAIANFVSLVLIVICIPFVICSNHSKNESVPSLGKNDKL
jgi:hypothetical protein